MSYTAGQVSVWNGVGWEQAVSPFWSPSPGSVSAYGTGTNIAFPGTAHTDSAWVEVIGSATAGKALAMAIGVHINGANTGTLIEIAKGTAGGEVVILPKTPVGSWNITASNLARNALFIPIQINQGDRISARIQGARTTGSAVIFSPITVQANNTTTATAVDVYGASTATSKGVALSNTADVYVEVTGSATTSYGALIAVASAGATTLGARNGLITIATGAAGAEVDIFSKSYAQTTTEIVSWNTPFVGLAQNDVFYSSGTVNSATPATFLGNNIWPVFIPQGTRIAAKASFGTASEAQIAVIGVLP
jgi:hypothetical protein